MKSKNIKQTSEYNKKETDSQAGSSYQLEEGRGEGPGKGQYKGKGLRYKLLPVKYVTRIYFTRRIQQILYNNYKCSYLFKF